MRLAFTDDQAAFGDAVADLLANECSAAEVRAAWEADQPWSPERWRTLAEMGVVGMTAPSGSGGLGLGLVDLVLVLEEAGRAALPEPLAATTAVALPLLAAVSDDDVGNPHGPAADWIATIAAGEALVAIQFEDDPFAVGGAQADLVLVADGGALLGFTDADWEVARSDDRSRRLARRTSGQPAFTVPADVAGEPLVAAFDRAAVADSAELIGVARQLLDVTVEYAGQREQFDQPIGGFQAVKHHLADALLGIEFAAPAVYRAAWSLDQGTTTASRDASMAKAMAGDAAEATARAALQVHGAIGFTFEHDLHLWMKRAWALAAAHGSAAWHRARVAAAIL